MADLYGTPPFGIQTSGWPTLGESTTLVYNYAFENLYHRAVESVLYCLRKEVACFQRAGGQKLYLILTIKSRQSKGTGEQATSSTLNCEL